MGEKLLYAKNTYILKLLCNVFKKYSIQMAAACHTFGLMAITNELRKQGK
jgi:hypothetical protein